MTVLCGIFCDLWCHHNLCSNHYLRNRFCFIKLHSFCRLVAGKAKVIYNSYDFATRWRCHSRTTTSVQNDMIEAKFVKLKRCFGLFKVNTIRKVTFYQLKWTIVNLVDNYFNFLHRNALSATRATAIEKCCLASYFLGLWSQNQHDGSPNQKRKLKFQNTRYWIIAALTNSYWLPWKVLSPASILVMIWNTIQQSDRRATHCFFR